VTEVVWLFSGKPPPNAPYERGTNTKTDIPRLEMILDGFSAFYPVPVSELIDKSVPATNCPITPTSGLKFRSFSDSNVNQPLLEYAHESFYQQHHVLGAWEHERGFE
jgi:hypothetical protein